MIGNCIRPSCVSPIASLPDICRFYRSKSIEIDDGRQGVPRLSRESDNKRTNRAAAHTRAPTTTPYLSGCIATPGRSIPVTMEALRLLLPKGNGDNGVNSG